MEFNIFHFLASRLGLDKYCNDYIISILSTLIVFFLLLIASFLVFRSIKKHKDEIVPSSKFNLHNIMEIVVEWFLNLVRGIIGDKAEKFVPLIATLFIYIFCCNLLGFIPGFTAPTTVITTNLGCAIFVFLYYNYVGIREHGFKGYIKHFLGPIIWLAPLFLVIEIISHIVRPISLSIRLYGNMMGDHMVLGIFSELTPVIVPIFFIILGIFISFIQAFVFSILSTVYIALAVED